MSRKPVRIRHSKHPGRSLEPKRSSITKARLQLECLEDRCLPSVFTPTTFADGGAGSGSLRDAILTTNADPGSGTDVIRLRGGTYSLMIQNGPGGQENAAASGDLDITNTSHILIIAGAGSTGNNATIIDATGLNDRVFQIVNPGTQVIFENLEITGGLARDDGTDGALPGSTDARGGGILNNGGNLVLWNVLLEKNKAQGGTSGNAQGGGLYSTGGDVTGFGGTQFIANIAQGGDGVAGKNGATGTFVGGPGGPGGPGGHAQGGGVYVADGVFGGQNLTFTSDVALGGHGGVGGVGGNATARDRRGHPIGRGGAGGAGGNAGAAQGGGLFITVGLANLDQASFVTDIATGGPGGAGGRGGSGRFPGRAGAPGAGGAGQGGGVILAGGTLNLLNNSKLTSDQAQGGSNADGQGGGLYLAGGIVTITHAQISANVAQGREGEGGGLYLADGSVTIAQSQISANVAQGSSNFGQGGGAFMAGGSLNLSTTLIKSNVARGGTNGSAAQGGGMFVGGGTLKLDSVTIEANVAQGGGDGQGGGMYVGGGTLSLVNTTIKSNVASGGNGVPGAGGVPTSSSSSSAVAGGPGGGGGNGQGGGIYLAGGTLSLMNTTIKSNLAQGGNGGPGGNGRGRAGGSSSSSSTSNPGVGGGSGGPGGKGQGGGIYVAGGTITLNTTTITDNLALGGHGENGGAGIAGAPGGRFPRSGGNGDGGGNGGNGGDAQGGAVLLGNGTVNLSASQIFKNEAEAGNAGSGGAGGAGGAAGRGATSRHLNGGNGGAGGNGGQGGSATGGGVYRAGGTTGAGFVLHVYQNAVLAGDGGKGGKGGLGGAAGRNGVNGSPGHDGGPSSAGSAQAINIFHLVADILAAGFPSPTIAGVAGSFTVTAQDATGNTNNSYTGTVHFSSSDPMAILPADYTFTPADGGVHTFTATLKTAGAQSITVTDNNTPSLTSTLFASVNPATASSLVVSGFPSPLTAGVAGSFTVTAMDAFGNIATGYTGTVAFTSSDAQGSLPAAYTFIAADNGSHTFSATLKTAGTQSITATDTAASALTATQSGIVIGPASAASLSVAAPANISPGTAFSITVTALDAFNNVAISYTGTVSFTSTDGNAVLPGSYTFTAADQGVHTFANGVTLNTAGSQTITATGTAIPAGLISWWPGEGDANDLVGGNNGTLVGGVTFAPGEVGQAFSLNGVDGYVNFGSAPAFDVQDFTLDAWVSVDPAQNTGDRRVISRDDINMEGPDGRQLYTLKSSSSAGGDGNPSFEILQGEEFDAVTAPSPLTAGFHHLAATRSESTISLYVDGVLVASTTTGITGPLSPNAPLVLGQVSPAFNGEFFQGLADEVDIFGRALSAAEIQSIFNVGTAGKQHLTITGSASVTVGSGGGPMFVVTGSPLAAGVPFSVKATALDSHGNVAGGHIVTVHFGSTHKPAARPSGNIVAGAVHRAHRRHAARKSDAQTIAVTDMLFSSKTGNDVINMP